MYVHVCNALQFVSVEKHVEQLLERLPGFLEACHQFTSSVQQVNTRSVYTCNHLSSFISNLLLITYYMFSVVLSEITLTMLL